MHYRRLILTLLFPLFSNTIWPQGVITTLAGTEFVFSGDGKAATASSIGAVFGVSVDASGNLYVASPTQNLIFRVASGGILRTLAGNGIKGFSGEGAAATSAALNFPTGTAVAPDGSVYVADFENHCVRRIRTDGVIETVAGDKNAIEIGDGGPALLASLFVPTAVALDAFGRLYIADNGNHRIRRVDADGTIRTIAGSGAVGYSGDGGPAVEAALASPQGVAVDSAGVVYFSDTVTHTVRRIGLDGRIATVAGRGTRGFGGDGGPAAQALLNEPRGITLDRDGRIYVADTMNHRLRRISANGVIATIAGTGGAGFGGDGGPAAGAILNEVSGVAVDSLGAIYVADLANARVRRIGTDGRIATVAGNGLSKFSGDGGPAAAAALDSPQGIGAAADGSFIIADSVNNRLRRVTPDGVIRTIAGTGEAGFSGDGGSALAARLSHPQGTVAHGPDGAIYFCDRKNNRVRKIDPAGTIRTIAGNGTSGFSGDGGPAIQASLNFPADVELDTAGNIYIADRLNHRVRRVRPDGVIETVAGTGAAGFAGDGGPARDAQLREPTGVTGDNQGNLYICDYENSRVRRLGPDGVILTIAGNGERAFTGDGKATEVGINGPYKAILDAGGNLLIADVFAWRIRRLNPNGLLETIAGNGEARYSGDGDSPLNAGLFFPVGLALKPNGVLLIADAGNDRIRGVLAQVPAWNLSRTSVALAARSNGAAPPAETVTATSTIPGVRFKALAETVSGGPWLTVTAPAPFLTQVLSITADPRGLAPGEYKGQILIDTPGAAPVQGTIDVVFTVAIPQGQVLEVVPGELVFSVPEGGSEEQLVLVRNNSNSPVSLAVEVEGDGADRWIQVDTGSGVVSTVTPHAVLLRASPSKLAQGEYRASIRLLNIQTEERSVLPVRMVVTSPLPVLRLGLNGLSFQAMEGPDAADFPQKIGVLNTGRGSMNWSATIVEDAGPVRWLTLGDNSAVSEAEGLTVPEFTVGVRAGGLAVGEYRARLRVSAPAAGNPVDFVDIVLTVIRRGATPRPLLTRAGLISVVAEGASPPASAATGILNLQQNTLEFRAIGGTLDGASWLTHRPSAGSLAHLESIGVVLQPNSAGLAAGVYQGVVTFIFSQQDPRNVQLVLLVTPRPSVAKTTGQRTSTATCEASRLEMVFTQLASGFVVKPGQPVSLEVQAVDDCGVPLRDGIAMATFNDGGKPIRLSSLKDGRWSGTWIPDAAASNQPVSIRVFAVTPGPKRLQNEINIIGRTGNESQR